MDKNSKGEETPGLARVLLRFEGDDEVGEEGEEDDDEEEEEEEEDEEEEEETIRSRVQRATILSTKSPSSCLARCTGNCKVCASLDSRYDKTLSPELINDSEEADPPPPPRC